MPQLTNMSAAGFEIALIASNTFPTGIILTNFADDIDPFDLPSLQIADSVMGLNGNLGVFSKANPILITIGVMPNTVDDELLTILFNANRVGYGKIGAKDIITLTGIYPTGRTVTLQNGFLTDGIPGMPISSGQRLKSKSYTFKFAGMSSV